MTKELAKTYVGKENERKNVIPEGLAARRVRESSSYESLLKEEKQLHYTKYAEDPRQKPSGMTPNFTGVTRPSSFRPCGRQERNIGAALYPAYQHCGMTNAANAASGFTLVELLVVVLIIGILAAVALPQYNKAVRKARLSEVASTFSSISKGIDAWLLENDGYPSSFVWFSGNGTGSGHAKLDIQQSCATEDSEHCYTKVGEWHYYCESTVCGIWLNTIFKADKSTGNKWLDGGSMVFVKRPNQEWGIFPNAPASAQPEICRWWKSMYGADRVVDSVGNASTACNAYF